MNDENNANPFITIVLIVAVLNFAWNLLNKLWQNIKIILVSHADLIFLTIKALGFTLCTLLAIFLLLKFRKAKPKNRPVQVFNIPLPKPITPPPVPLIPDKPTPSLAARAALRGDIV